MLSSVQSRGGCSVTTFWKQVTCGRSQYTLSRASVVLIADWQAWLTAQSGWAAPLEARERTATAPARRIEEKDFMLIMVQGERVTKFYDYTVPLRIN
jgi:hypothetical protein